jgi:glyoxylase-like metal-dependent hydrolase (beta-lactamase superfamily II)
MNHEIYQFRLGSFICTVICDGTFNYAPPVFPPPANFIFSLAPKDKIDELFKRHIFKNEDHNRWISSFNCLLIDSGEHQVLIDTGGDGFGPDTGKLFKNLISAGASQYSIRHVILTHGHPDHIGGSTDSKGSVAFPNARYYISKTEWDFWRSGRAEKEIREYNRERLLKTEYDNLPAIRNQTVFVEGEREILPGITLIPVPGHTPGQIAVFLNSRDRKLLYISDAFFHPVQIEYPEWAGIADLDPEQTIVSRYRLLGLAVKENALVLGFHFPFPGLGWIVKHQNRFAWLTHLTNLHNSIWELKQ